MRTIYVTQPDHPVVEVCGKEFQIWSQNGPMIKAVQGVETLSTRAVPPPIVCSAFGEGRVIIFSPYPEGSLEGECDPEECATLGLLENVLTLASRKEALVAAGERSNGNVR